MMSGFKPGDGLAGAETGGAIVDVGILIGTVVGRGVGVLVGIAVGFDVGLAVGNVVGEGIRVGCGVRERYTVGTGVLINFVGITVSKGIPVGVEVPIKLDNKPVAGEGVGPEKIANPFTASEGCWNIKKYSKLKASPALNPVISRKEITRILSTILFVCGNFLLWSSI